MKDGESGCGSLSSDTKESASCCRGFYHWNYSSLGISWLLAKCSVIKSTNLLSQELAENNSQGGVAIDKIMSQAQYRPCWARRKPSFEVTQYIRMTKTLFWRVRWRAIQHVAMLSACTLPASILLVQFPLGLGPQRRVIL